MRLRRRHLDELELDAEILRKLARSRDLGSVRLVVLVENAERRRRHFRCHAELLLLDDPVERAAATAGAGPRRVRALPHPLASLPQIVATPVALPIAVPISISLRFIGPSSGHIVHVNVDVACLGR